MSSSRVVLDTNVVLSAILCGGNPAEYFALAWAGRIDLFTSPFILEELTRILTGKFRWKDGEVEQAIAWYTSLARVVKPEILLNVIKRKPSDNRILECAVEAGADYLVTGDKRDLLPLKRIRGVRIVSPIEGLALIG